MNDSTNNLQLQFYFCYYKQSKGPVKGIVLLIIGKHRFHRAVQILWKVPIEQLRDASVEVKHAHPLLKGG